MSLNDRLVTLGHREDKNKCSVQRLIEDLDPETASTLKGLLQNPNVPTSAIHREMRAENYFVGRGSLANHRNHVCHCKEIA